MIFLKQKPRNLFPSVMVQRQISRKNSLLSQPDIKYFQLLISKNYKENQAQHLGLVDQYIFMQKGFL